MFSTIFMLLVAYYVLKTVREPLILATGGATLSRTPPGCKRLVLLLYVPLYGIVGGAPAGPEAGDLGEPREGRLHSVLRPDRPSPVFPSWGSRSSSSSASSA
jgi:hypothetical protein